MAKHVIKPEIRRNSLIKIKKDASDGLPGELSGESAESRQSSEKVSSLDTDSSNDRTGESGSSSGETPDGGQGESRGEESGSSQVGGRGGKSGSGKGGSFSGRNKSENNNNLFLIPVIILVVIALISWSWLALLSPGFSKKAEPYINKYYPRIVGVLSFMSGNRAAENAGVTTDASGNNIGTDLTDENTDSSDESSGSSATSKESNNQGQTTDEKKPSIKLQIYEGPEYSAADGSCIYKVKAVVTGSPTPIVQFSRDDSKGTLGPKTTQINLKRNATQYTLTATASNENGTAMDSLTINWGCNMPPVISGIILSSDIVYINKEYDVTVTASDPDKDGLTYKWTVTGGTLSSDNSASVKWTTPPNPENYQVKVDVKDSKGTLTSKTISVYVGSEKAPETTAPPVTAPPTTAPPTTAPATTSPQQQSLDLVKKTGEGGYLEYRGETFAGGNVYAGDSAANKPCVGFISFDISPLAGKTITAARLTFVSVSVQGNPLSHYDSFWINVVDWGAEPIVQGDFDLPGIAIQSFASPEITCTVDKLKSELQKAIGSGKTRFQIRVWFSGLWTNSNSAKDGWEYAQQSINLNATYQ